MQRGGRLLTVLAVAMCTITGVPAQVWACSCNPEPLYSTIPKTGAAGVPLDIAPVLEGPFDASSLSFADESGKAVEFTLALGPQVGCMGGWAEVLPKQRLAPNTRYTLKVSALYPESLSRDHRVASLSFTTGDSELPDEPLARPTLSAASVMRGAPDCGGVPVVMACLGRVKPAEPSHVELLMRRGSDILLRTTHFIQSDVAFGLKEVPDCIELRRRAIDGRRSEPATICGDALPVSDFTPADKNSNGWVTCKDGLIGAAADSGATHADAMPADQDAGFEADAAAPIAGGDASVRTDDPPASASGAAAPSSAQKSPSESASAAAGCAVSTGSPVDLWLLLALGMPLAAARRRRLER